MRASPLATEWNTDAFVTKLTAAGALAYSTYLGGMVDENGYGIAVDGCGHAYVTGFTVPGLPHAPCEPARYGASAMRS